MPDDKAEKYLHGEPPAETEKKTEVKDQKKKEEDLDDEIPF